MSIAETPHLMREERMGMRSVCAFSVSVLFRILPPCQA